MTNTNKLIEIAKANGAYGAPQTGDWLEEGNILFASIAQLQATIDAVNASQSEAIYQYCHSDKLWHDCTYDVYAKHIDYPECEARIVYLAP